MIQLMQQFMTGEEMARVAARSGDDLFVPYSRDDIVGEYDFSVEGGSTQPINDTIRKQQAVSLMNALAPLIGIVVDPAALARYVLQQGFDVVDPEKFIIQQQPNMPVPARRGHRRVHPRLVLGCRCRVVRPPWGLSPPLVAFHRSWWRNYRTRWGLSCPPCNTVGQYVPCL